MAEQIKNKRTLEQILRELFEDEKKTNRNGITVKEDCALKKYAKVREARYEVGLHVEYNLPLNEVKVGALKYFEKAFLNGENAYYVNPYDFDNGFQRLCFAEEACKKRCTNLVIELNEALSDLLLEKVNDIQNFLDFLTFHRKVRRNNEGKPIMEKPYNFPVCYFLHRDNFKYFLKEVMSLLKEGKMISMQDIRKNVNDHLKIKEYKERIASRREKDFVNL